MSREDVPTCSECGLPDDCCCVCEPQPLQAARLAKERLARKLRWHRNVNGIGLVKFPDTWDISVNLVKPHKWWHRKLPGLYFDGVRVHYKVIGEVRAC